MSLVKRTDRLPFIFDDIFNADWFGGISNAPKIGFNTPAVNIKEAEDEFVIQLAAPGLVKSDFNIELDNDVLKISSEVQKGTSQKKDSYTKKEFEYNQFNRSFTLPDTIKVSAIIASYEQGILSVTLPKKEEAKIQPKRSIEIS